MDLHSTYQIPLIVQKTCRWDWPELGPELGKGDRTLQESLSCRVNGRVALSSLETITGLLGRNQDAPHSPFELKDGKWTYLGSSPFTHDDKKHEISGWAAVALGFFGGVVLFFPACQQLKRDLRLFKEVQMERNALSKVASDDSYAALLDSIRLSYQRGAVALRVRVKQEIWFLGAYLILSAAQMAALKAVFSQSWWYGRAALAAGCGALVLFTVGIMVGSSSKDRIEFQNKLKIDFENRNRLQSIDGNPTTLSMLGDAAKKIEARHLPPALLMVPGGSDLKNRSLPVE